MTNLDYIESRIINEITLVKMQGIFIILLKNLYNLLTGNIIRTSVHKLCIQNGDWTI